VVTSWVTDPRRRPKEERVSYIVTFQTIDVGLVQGLVFDYVRGKGTLEVLRPQVRRRYETILAFVPWKGAVAEAYREHRDRFPAWFNLKAFEHRRFLIVEDAPDRVAELVDLYHNAPDDATVHGLIESQLALLGPKGSNEPWRWVPKPVEWGWDVDEQVERSMALLPPYAATPDGGRKKPLDREFARDVLEFNEDLQLVAEVNDYPLGTVAHWATSEFSECLEPPDDLFRPLFAEHPELEADLARVDLDSLFYGAGRYVRPANVPRARRAVEASLPEAGELDVSDEFALNALRELAELLRYAERRGLGLIERCA
jgi:hypothetical protein